MSLPCDVLTPCICVIHIGSLNFVVRSNIISGSGDRKLLQAGGLNHHNSEMVRVWWDLFIQKCYIHAIEYLQRTWDLSGPGLRLGEANKCGLRWTSPACPAVHPILLGEPFSSHFRRET